MCAQHRSILCRVVRRARVLSARERGSALSLAPLGSARFDVTGERCRRHRRRCLLASVVTASGGRTSRWRQHNAIATARAPESAHKATGWRERRQTNVLGARTCEQEGKKIREKGEAVCEPKENEQRKNEEGKRTCVGVRRSLFDFSRCMRIAAHVGLIVGFSSSR